MDSHDTDTLSRLIAALPQAPAGWVEAAQELPLARRGFDDIVGRAEADAVFRARLVADLESALAEVGVEPTPPLLSPLRRRVATGCRVPYGSIPPVGSLEIDHLLDAIGARTPAPGSGSSAALVGAIAAALCTKTARFSDDEGAAAQAEALRRRLQRLAAEDAQAFTDALRHLDQPSDPDPERRDFALGRSLARAADAPLRIADACADVAILAAGLAETGKPELQADAAAAAVLAHASTRAAAHLVRVNLGATNGDPRIARAGAYVEAANAAALRGGA